MGAQGPRAREGRRRRATGCSRRSRRRSRRSCARPSTRASGAKDGDLAPLPVRPRERRADGDGEPARPPREEAGAHPRERARRASGTSSGSSNPPLFEYDDETKRLGRRAPRLHAPARRLRRPARQGPGQGPLLALRPRAQRLRDRRRLDPPPRPGGAGEGLPRARHLGRGGAAASSASCSTRSASARRRTAGSRIGMDRLAMLLSRRREPARRHPVPQDAEGHGPDDRRAERRVPRAARRAQDPRRRTARA